MTWTKQSREKLLVWARKIGDGTLVGPIFHVSVEIWKFKCWPLHLINDDVIPAVLQHGRYHQNLNGSVTFLCWFQDGSLNHIVVVVRRRLQELFPGRVIGIGHNIVATKVPRLDTPRFLVGAYQAKVHQTPSANLQVLRRRRMLFVSHFETEGFSDERWTLLSACSPVCGRNGRHVEGRGGRWTEIGFCSKH